MSLEQVDGADWRSAKKDRMRALFAPRSVALVGVSDNNDMSRCVHANMLRHGFQGRSYLVNPNRDTVHGQRSLKSLSSIAEPIDMVFALVSGSRLLDLMEEAGECGVRSVCVLGGGFGENGLQGEERQRLLNQVAAKHSQVVLGPNTIGYLNVPAGCVFYGSPLRAPIYTDLAVVPGDIGFVIQSGIIAHAALRGMLVRNVGPSLIVATGNEANLEVHDVIDYLVDDEATKVIGLFIETIRDHEGFRRAAQRALEAGKPIVAMKAGRSAVAAKTAISHTGALVGDAHVYSAAFEKLGVISVPSLDDLMVTCAYLSNYGVPSGRRAALVAVSGGFCEIFADRAAEVGIETPEFSRSTIAALTKILPDTGTASNPLDTTGAAQTDPNLFPRSIDIITKDPNFDVLFVQRSVWTSSIPDVSAVIGTYRPWATAIAASPIPVVLVGDLMAQVSDFEADFLKASQLPPEIGGLQHGLAAFAAAAGWAEFRRHNLQRIEAPAALESKHYQPLSGERRGTWAEHCSLDWLAANGIPVVPWRLAKSREAAVAAANELGYPAVVKVSSAQLPHKSAVGGVVLGLADAEDVRDAFDVVVDAARRHDAAIEIDGALVMPMRERALELIVGIVRDPTWGLTLAVGLGGVWTEVLNDSNVTPLPVSGEEVKRLLLGLRGARLFSGGHGVPKVDMEKLAQTIVDVADLAAAAGDSLESLEVNPIRVAGNAIEALDSLVIWRDR